MATPVEPQHVRMAWAIAAKAARRYPMHELGELAAVAMLAVVEAAGRHDPSRSSLATYAGHRAKGAVLDFVRWHAPTSRRGLASGKIRQVVQLSAMQSDLLYAASGRDADPLRSRRLRAALRRLPPRDLRILAGYFGRDMTLKELGEELGLAPTSVKFHRDRALARLREELAGAPA